MEFAFCEYIQNINDFAEDKEIDIEETKDRELELLKSVADDEKKLINLQDRKKQVMEQYVQGGLEIDEYKKMIEMFNENFEVLENEIQRKKAELATGTEKPKLLPEDVILNLKQNWDKLNNGERMIFLQKFVKRIIITVEKVTFSSNRVRIDGIEFHSGGFKS